MEWSKSQRQALKYLHAHRTNNPTVSEHIPTLVIRLGVAVLIGVAMYVTFVTESPAATWLVIGILVGALLRDVRHLISSVRTWPLFRAVIDWDRVEQLEREQETSTLRNAT